MKRRDMPRDFRNMTCIDQINVCPKKTRNNPAYPSWKSPMRRNFGASIWKTPLNLCNLISKHGMLEIQPILYGSDNFTTIATPGKSSDPGAMTALFAAFGAAACSPAFDPVQNLPTLLPWRLKIPQDGYPFDGTSIVDSAETWWWYDSWYSLWIGVFSPHCWLYSCINYHIPNFVSLCWFECGKPDHKTFILRSLIRPM